MGLLTKLGKRRYLKLNNDFVRLKIDEDCNLVYVPTMRDFHYVRTDLLRSFNPKEIWFDYGIMIFDNNDDFVSFILSLEDPNGFFQVISGKDIIEEFGFQIL